MFHPDFLRQDNSNRKPERVRPWRPPVIEGDYRTWALQTSEFAKSAQSRTPSSQGLSSCLVFPLLNLCPGIAQRDGAVEDKPLSGGIGINAEISQALELIVRLAAAPFTDGSSLARSMTSSEFGLRLARKSCPSGDIIRIFLEEQVFVDADLGIERVICRYPVNGRLHLTIVGRIAATGCGIVRAVYFDDFPLLVFIHAGALDEVAAAQADLAARARGGRTSSADLRGSRPARCRARARTALCACRRSGLPDC